MTDLAVATQEVTEPAEVPDGRDAARRGTAALRELTRPVRTPTRIAMVLAAVGALAMVVPFVGIARLGELLLSPGPVDRPSVAAVGWIVVAGLLTGAVATGGALYVTHVADVRMQSVLRTRMIERLGRVPLGWFADHPSGEVRKSAQDDVGELHHLVAHHEVERVQAIVLPLAGVGYAFWLDWRLGLLSVATIPLYAGIFAWMMRDFMDKMPELDRRQARISAAVVEFVNGIAVVKTFGRARRAHARYADAAVEFNRFFGQWTRPLLKAETSTTLVLSAPVVAVVGLAGGFWFTSAGWVTPVEAMTTVLLALVIPTTLITLNFGMQARRQAAAAALRITELLDTPEQPVAAQPRTPDGAGVEFDDVRFRYPNGTLALDGVSLRCAPGTVTALVGPSGSGKSTLATLLPRFHDVTGGAVRLGGVDVREIAPSELYRRVGLVLQDVALLRASVADNIRLGRPDATDEQVHEAARTARIHDRIMALDRGYDAVIGADAVLSGGEEQRISIARALLADAPVLVLDEATAFVDPESEAAIQDGLARLAVGRTVLVIGHRLSTMTDTDQIVVLDRGRVAESGTHAGLLAADGKYASLWRAMEEDGAVRR